MDDFQKLLRDVALDCTEMLIVGHEAASKWINCERQLPEDASIAVEMIYELQEEFHLMWHYWCVGVRKAERFIEDHPVLIERIEVGNAAHRIDLTVPLSIVENMSVTTFHHVPIAYMRRVVSHCSLVSRLIGNNVSDTFDESLIFEQRWSTLDLLNAREYYSLIFAQIENIPDTKKLLQIRQQIRLEWSRAVTQSGVGTLDIPKRCPTCGGTLSRGGLKKNRQGQLVRTVSCRNNGVSCYKRELYS